jgi:hypothetical protein
MDFYTDDPPAFKHSLRVRCPKCGEPSNGHYYCFDCWRDHAESVRVYMARRRQDESFVAAERVETKLRMRRLRARRRLFALGGDR